MPGAKTPDTAALDRVFGAVVPAVEQISNWRASATPSPESVAWDSSPTVITINKVDYEFFEIGALAEALGRRAVTVRSWEDRKILPKAPYRTKPPRPFKNTGKVTSGRRLYTRKQIEAAVAAAKVSGVYDPSATPNWAEFSRLVRAAWLALLDQPI